jgi:hypothetical protein
MNKQNCKVAYSKYGMASEMLTVVLSSKLLHVVVGEDTSYGFKLLHCISVNFQN